MKRRAMFVGRFQPFHRGHEWLVRKKLDQGIPVLIAVRETPRNERNPFTPDQVEDMIAAAFEGEDVETVVIPDIESINYGRGVGYTLEDHGECPIEGISATDIRKKINNGESISEWVPKGVERWILDFVSG